MLLTIVIPTYDRPLELKRLLDWLTVEHDHVRGLIRVIISDNASPGGVPKDVLSIIEGNPWMEILQQASNVGPEQNFLNALSHVKTAYFWLLGDDDLFAVNLLKPLIVYLDAECPDLLYLPSNWNKNNVEEKAKKYKNGNRKFSNLSDQQLATLTHVYLTFISSWIVKSMHFRLTDLRNGPNTLLNTNLVQMSWMIEALSKGQKFAIANQVSIFASAGNTGGYKLITVFGKNLPEILVDRLQEKQHLLDPIMKHLSWALLPSLIHYSRRQIAHNFETEDLGLALSRWRNTWVYKILYQPMMTLPRPAAFVLFVFVKLVDRWWTLRGQLMVQKLRLKNLFQ